MSKTLLSREKPLEAMGTPELVMWIKALCDLWYFEYSNLSTGLTKIKKEMLRAFQEFERR